MPTKCKEITGAQPYFFGSIDAIVHEIKEVLETGQLTQGMHISTFEIQCARAFGSKYALGVNSGGTGLELILRAMDIRGKEVIVPTNTFVASASSVIQAGGRVVFADIDKETLSLNLESVRSLINENTVAVMTVHMFGLMSENISELQQLCKRHHLYFIEDAAHAHGAKYRGIPAGSLGDAACFSFFATKVVTTGEGGVITTDNQVIAERVGQLRNHGKCLNKPEYEMVSNNYRLAEIPAILGKHQMNFLEENIKRRNEIARQYLRKLADLEEIEFLTPDVESLHSYWRFPLYLASSIDRRKLQTDMAQNFGVRITWMYEPLCHLQPLFQATHQHQEGDFPVAEKCMRGLINLPTHMGITDEDIDVICQGLKESL